MLFQFLEYYGYNIRILISNAVAGTMNIRMVLCGALLHIFKQYINVQASVLLPPGYANSGSMDRPVIVSDVLTQLSLRWLLLMQRSFSEMRIFFYFLFIFIFF